MQGVSLEAATLQERLIFSSDALQLSKESPLIGFGGEAWATIYKSGQSMPYISNKIHNGYLEWLVDTGWIGMIVFIGVFLYFFYLIWKNRNMAVVNKAILVSLSVIFLHSFVDFNFSYSWVWLMIFWLLVMGLNSVSHRFAILNVKVTITLITVFALLLISSALFSYRFIVAEQAYEIANTTKSISVKEIELNKAVSYDPFNTSYRIKLIDLFLAKGDPNWIESMDDVIQLEPNNSNHYHIAGALAEKAGERELALTYYQKGLEVDHYNSSLYENTARLSVEIALERDADDRTELLDTAIEAFLENEKWHDYFLSQAPKEAERFNSRDFKITEKTTSYANLAYKLQHE